MNQRLKPLGRCKMSNHDLGCLSSRKMYVYEYVDVMIGLREDDQSELSIND